MESGFEDWQYDSSMPRFVILRHETPQNYVRLVHYDLMLEWGQSLRTWALLQLPTAGASVTAEELPPHRREYLNYEGEISAGRGRVSRCAAGEFQVLDEKPDFLRLRITSPTLAGTLEMAQESATSLQWTAVLAAPADGPNRGAPPEMLDTR